MRLVLKHPIEYDHFSSTITLLIVNSGGLPEDAVEDIGEAILNAKSPLVVTGYLGRQTVAVDNLIRLVDLASIFYFAFASLLCGAARSFK